jgi:hypothetical protein
MRKSFIYHLFPALALVLLFSGTPRVLAAQDQAGPQQCSATAVPAEVEAGQAAVRVTFTFSEAIGAVTDLKAPEESGIKLAVPDDLPRQEMANPEIPPKPIEMSLENASEAYLWLNTGSAVEGQYEIALTGAQGSCTGHLTISGAGSR